MSYLTKEDQINALTREYNWYAQSIPVVGSNCTWGPMDQVDHSNANSFASMHHDLRSSYASKVNEIMYTPSYTPTNLESLHSLGGSDDLAKITSLDNWHKIMDVGFKKV